MEVLQSDASTALFGEEREENLSIDEAIQQGTELTMSALVKARILTEDQAQQFTPYMAQSGIQVGDILPKMAELQGVEEDSRAQAVETWTRKMTFALKKRYPMIPFAMGVYTPTSFAERFPHLFEMSKALKVPILFAEDSDVIGLGTINPAVVDLISKEFVSAVLRKDLVRPFVTTVLLDVKTWNLLCRKAFGDD